VEGLSRLEGGVRSLALQFHEGLSNVDVYLDLRLARGLLAFFKVLEALHEHEAVVDEGVPSLSVGVDLTVLRGGIGLVDGNSVLLLERKQSGRGD
jgi:hypothetical protein